MNEWFSGLEIPQPKDELRRSALAAATERWSRPGETDRWHQVWESRPLRAAWAVTVVVLVAANLIQSRPPVAPPSSSSGPDELSALIKLPRLRSGYAAGAPEPRVEFKKEKRT